MRVTSDAQEDSPLAVVALQPRLRSVRALAGYELLVEFDDGLSGVVGCKGLILGPQSGVFAYLQDETRFAAVRVEHGAVTWDGDLDIAPDAMYDQVSANGRWDLA